MKLLKIMPAITLFLVVLMVGCKKDDKTENTPLVIPTVTSTDPANNESSVARNKVVTFTFSEAMDAATINTSSFTLKQGSTAVPGTVNYSGTTATFTPTNTLAAGTTYTATLTNDAKNIAGTSLAENKEIGFTSGGTTLSLDAVDLGTSANYVILAKTGISNISTSIITGDLGLSPAATTYVTGL
jgi:hypothetical protein